MRSGSTYCTSKGLASLAAARLSWATQHDAVINSVRNYNKIDCTFVIKCNGQICRLLCALVSGDLHIHYILHAMVPCCTVSRVTSSSSLRYRRRRWDSWLVGCNSIADPNYHYIYVKPACNIPKCLASAPRNWEVFMLRCARGG